jgi:integrative and conjugative element protein (TIGR02256 family)
MRSLQRLVNGGSPMNLILTKKAYRSIFEECASFPEVETGGIMVGKRADAINIVVPFIIGSGPQAKRSLTRYSPDVNWQQNSLEKLFDRYRVNFVGSFHRHPGSFNCPSSLDYRTAQWIINSPDWSLSEAVFPIIIYTGREMKFFPYYISKALKDFQPISWQIVSPRNRLVRNILKRS